MTRTSRLASPFDEWLRRAAEQRQGVVNFSNHVADQQHQPGQHALLFMWKTPSSSRDDA